MNPIELPVVGVLVVAFVALGFSRVLLAVPKEASVWITVAVPSSVGRGGGPRRRRRARWRHRCRGSG